MLSEQVPPALAISAIPIKFADESVEAFVSPLLVMGHEVVVVEASPDSPFSEETTSGVGAKTSASDGYKHPPPGVGKSPQALPLLALNLIWVLHIDISNLAPGLAYLQDLITARAPSWGRFDVELRGDHPGLAWVSRATVGVLGSGEFAPGIRACFSIASYSIKLGAFRISR